MRLIERHILLRVLILCNIQTVWAKPVLADSFRVISLLSFGANGDGQFDNYQALRNAADYLSKNSNVVLKIPKGIFYVGQVGKPGDMSRHVTFENCNNIRIEGTKGSVISVKGDFYKRAVTEIPGRPNHFRTDVEQIVPFYFKNCNNFVLTKLEIRGNVQKMTRAAGVVESFGGNAVVTYNSRNYEMSDLYIHHFSTDGLQIGISQRHADRNAVFNRIRSANNARQGLSILHLVNGEIRNSEFREMGRTGGTYGGHWPKSGVDIEPPYWKTIDQKTGNIRFNNCQFIGNIGAQFVAGVAPGTENITLSQVKVKAFRDSSPFVVLFGFPGATLENSIIYTKRGAIYPNHEGHFSEWERSAVVRGNTIFSSTPEPIVDSGRGNLVLKANRVIPQNGWALW